MPLPPFQRKREAVVLSAFPGILEPGLHGLVRFYERMSMSIWVLPLWSHYTLSIFCSFNWIPELKVSLHWEAKGLCKGMQKERGSEGQGHPFPGALKGLLCGPRAPDRAHTHTHTLRSRQNKVRQLRLNSAPPWCDLPSLKILYKQVLLTGLTSEMAFFLFPGTHQELRGGSCSIDQSAIDSASDFDKLLGSLKVWVGLGPVKAALLNY